MSSFAPLNQMVVSALLNQCLQRPQKSICGIIFAVFSAALSFMGIMFVIFASYRWLADQYYIWQALALTAGEVVGLSLLTGLMAFLLLRKRKNILWRSEEKIKENTGLLFETFLRDTEDHIYKNPKITLAIALIAGVLAGKKFL